MDSGGPRGALPSQSIFLTGAEKGSYLAGRSSFRHRLRALTEHSGGYSPDEATRVARTLLPDILVFDTTRRASYSNNGRTLADDVMDIFLSILTNGKITRDNVEPHKDLLASFPYIGSPHAARSVEQVRGRTNIA